MTDLYCHFDYDADLRLCKFHYTSHEHVDEHVRVRVLTYEDSINLRTTGFVTPVQLPDGLSVDNTKAAQWAAALRLCSHDMRPLYAQKAVEVNVLPSQFLPFVERNRDGHMMPLPYWVSSGNLQSIRFLTVLFLGRIAPLWIGSMEILVFYDDTYIEDPCLSDLPSFLKKELSGTAFDTDLLLQWQSDVVSWSAQLTEKHHTYIDARTLLEQGKACMIRFDLHSLTEVLQGRAEALRTYRTLADGCMRKCVADAYPDANSLESFFLFPGGLCFLGTILYFGFSS